MADIELLLEAERRGILPPDKLALLTEAKARGLIGGPPAPQVVQTKPEDVGYLEGGKEALIRGAKGYGKSASGTSLAVSSVLGNEEAARKKMTDIKTEQKKVEEKPALTVEDLERIYAERGLGAAAGQVPKYITQQFLQSAPEMAGPLAVGAGATALAAPLGPGAPVVGALAGIGAYGLQQFGHFLVRQAEEKNDPKELEVAKAAFGAAATAPVGYFVDKWTAGLGGMGQKKAGEQLLKELTARQIAARTGKRAAGGATVGIIAEAPLEVIEQGVERWQAGLPLTGDDAYNEYKEAFFGAAAVGGTLGGASRGIKGYREAKLENAAFRREEQAPGKDTFTEGDEYEDTGVDTGVSKQGVSASGEPEVGTATTAEGVGESDTSGLDAANRPVEELADREDAEQPALTEKQQFLGWLQQNNIVPTSERDIQMYEDMWRKTIAPTETIPPSGTPPLDQTPPLDEIPPSGKPPSEFDAPPPAAKKVGLTPEEWKIKKKIYDAEKWLRDNKDTQTEENLNQVLDYLTLKRAELATLSASLQPPVQTQEQVEPIVRNTKQSGFDFNAPEDPNKTPPVQTVDASTAPAQTPPVQEGFDFVEPDVNTQRDIVANEPSKGFELSAPSGQVLKGEGIEIIEGPPIAKLDLATENIVPVENLIRSLKPNTETPRQLEDFNGQTRTILDTIKEFLGLPLTYKPKPTKEEIAQGITEKPVAVDKGVELDETTLRRRLGVINTFFNTLSLAPQERQQKLQELRTALPGLTAEQQGQAFNEFLNIKNLNTVRGITELRTKLEEWLDSYEGALLGEGKSNAVLGKGRFGISWRKGQYVIRQGDTIALGPVMKAALSRLKGIHPDDRTPEENAAAVFFSRKSPYEQPFVFALRNAAYALSTKNQSKDPVYKGESAKNAALFQKWLSENAPDKIVEYFNATAADYEKQFAKAEKLSEEMRKVRAAAKKDIAGRYMPWLYREPSGKPERLSSEAGLGKFKKSTKPKITTLADFLSEYGELGATEEDFGRYGALTVQPDNPNLYRADSYYPMHPVLESAIRNNDLKGGLELMATSKDRYTAGVAKRFLELNLATDVTMDKQDEITLNYLSWAYDRPDSSRDKLFTYIKDIVPEVDTDLIKSPVTIPDLRAQLEMLDKLSNFGAMRPIKIELDKVRTGYKDLLDTIDNSKAAFYYHLNTINFNSKTTLTNNDFIHEVAHAASNYSLRETNFDKLTPKQQKAVGELKKLFELAKNNIASQNLLEVYGITDIDEFVAEAFANPEFQALLKKIPYKRYYDPTKMNVKNASLFNGTENRDIVISQQRQPQDILETIKTKTEKLWDDNYLKQQNNPLWKAAYELKTKIIPLLEFRQKEIAELENDLIPNSVSPEQKAKRERVLAALKEQVAPTYAQAISLLSPTDVDVKNQKMKQTQKDLFDAGFDVTVEKDDRTDEEKAIDLARAARRLAAKRKKSGVQEYDADTSAFNEFVYANDVFNVDNYLDLFYNEVIPREGAPGFYDKKNFPDDLKQNFEFAYQQAASRGDASFKFPINKKTFITFPVLQKPVGPAPQSLWDKFTRLIAELLGMDNVLGHTLANANLILQPTPTSQYDSNIIKVYSTKGKANVMAVTGTRQTRPESVGFLDSIFGERPSWQAMKSSVPFWLDSLKDATRKYYLGAFTLRQLEDMVGSKLPPLKRFIQNVESMLDARNAILAKTKDVVIIWQKFQSEHPGLAKVLNKLMIDATVETIDPSKFDATNYYGTGSPEAYDKLSKADKEKRKALDAAYKQIGPDGQKVYEEVKKFYADRLAAYKASLLDRIKQTLIADGIAEADVLNQPSYKKVEEYFKRHTLEPYFPLKRFGNHWLVINKGPGQLKEFYQFESALERNIFADQRSKKILTETGKRPSVDMGNSLRDIKWKGNLKELEFLKDLKELVRTGEGGDVKTLKGNLEESLEQLYLLQLPDQNVRKMFLPRKGTQGMDQDMLRAFTSSAFHMAYQHSRFAFGPKLFNAVKESEAFISGMDDPREAKRLRDYTGELAERVDYIMNPPDTGTIPSFLSNMSFIWYMTAPASALVNMLGVVAVGQPVLGARFGQAETAKTMMAYAKRVGATGFKDDNENWAFPSITRDAKLTPVQKEAVKRFIADGLFDITLNHDLVGLAESPSNLYTGRDKRIMQVLSGAFHGAEKFNREVIAMSAFDMAMKKYAKPENGGYKGDKLFNKAVEVTKDLTYKSMFDYSTLNKPRLFQGKWAKVVMQFKQFSQQMSFMLVRSGIEGFHNTFNYDNLIKKEQALGGGQLPELEDVRIQINSTQRLNGEPEYKGPALEAQVKKYYADVRSEGKKRLFGTLGMTFAFAGTTGLPGWWALGKLIEGMQAVFGDEDEADKPFDFNNWYKNWLAENMGNFWGDSISRGLMTQVSGANLADRMGLNDLWFRDARNSPDEVAAVQAFIVSLMGPSVGIGISAVEALKQMREGHLERGMETLSPAILKNLLKAGRFSETFGDGRATTLKGDVLIDDFGVGEIAAQAIGFSPERLSQKQKANIEMKTAEQEILDRRAALLNAYFMGVDNTDADLMISALEKIAVFNTSNPGRSIKPDNLKDSVLTRYRQRALAQTTGGINIDKKLIGQLGGMSAYGNE